MLDWITAKFAELHSWTFEAIVQPALYRFGFMNWDERTYEGTELFLIGILELLVLYALLRPLETRYASFGDLPQPSAHYVVVLGSGYAPRHGVAVTGALEGDGLTRITEGLRILRLAPTRCADQWRPCRSWQVLPRTHALLVRPPCRPSPGRAARWTASP